MELTRENFWDEYPRLVALLFPPLTLEDGYPEAEIAAAEERLGLPLPALLREFYARAGRREDVNRSLDRLLPPRRLTVQDGGWLVFYEENQGVTDWGIRRDRGGEPDPPVEVRLDSAPASWSEDFPTLSGFLVYMLLRQATEILPYAGGVGAATVAGFDAVTAGWERFSAGYVRGACKGGATALLFAGEDREAEHYVLFGCRAGEDVPLLEAGFGGGFSLYPPEG